MTTLATPPEPAPPFLRSRQGRRFLIQAAAVLVMALCAVYLFDRASRLELGLGFMDQRTGFALANQWLTTFDSDDPRWVAYGAGVFNTIRVVLVGIVFATLLGIVMGVARLSNNWLVSRLATVYVEIVRNTPLLVQIIFWHTVVLLQLPRISEAVNLGEVVYISNRALAIPWPQERGLAVLWVILAVVALAVAVWLRTRRLAEEAETGRSTHANLYALGAFIVLAGGAFVATGFPVGIDLPELTPNEAGTTLDYEGGIKITPEFAALLFALVAYTGSFITEIVRGSIQSLPRGQNEAAAALGLTGYQRMTLVILPQALRTMIPAVTNQYLNLSKNSSLAVVIGYSELFLVSNTILNNAGHAVPTFALIIGTYLVLNLIISAVMSWLNRRVQLAKI